MRQIIILLIPVFIGLVFYGCSERSAGSEEQSSGPRRAEVLFLGHNSEHHNSDRYAPWLATAVFTSGINLTYTTSLADLNTGNLDKYDGLVIYGNYDRLPASAEKALKAFVEGGKGLIALHSASGCFKNSEWYIKTIGGQFKSHGTDTFKAVITQPSHVIMEDIPEFETWDETYVHQNLNPDNKILMEREEGGQSEPYTWVRNQGEGRVFYTAYGHNDSTWTDPGFLQLLENGILWAIGDEVSAKIAALDIPSVSIYDSAITDFDNRHFVPRMQEALTPEQSMKLIQVPVDFTVELFAAEPDITNPIAMDWDEKGRLWIVESVDYPNTFAETDGAANDRIKICEDSDGDGKADKFTVFADSLNIPTSLVFADGGVIVSMAPHFVFLKDTDGDDKADERKIIMSGWGKNDTHSGPSNLQYGFDNKIWGVVGFSGFEGRIQGESMQFGSGVYRFSPDGKDFEYLATTSNNTWGLGFSEDNNVFISTANNTHSAFYSMPAAYTLRSLPETEEGDNIRPVDPVQKIDGHYEVHAMTPNLRQVDVLGGFTAAAGHHMYTARNYPKEYWNRIAFVNEPTVRLVHNAIITPQGAGFTEEDGWNLMASSDEWFGPVYTRVGPDGAVWVADWYNFIIQHNKFVESQAPSHLVLPFVEQPLGQGNAFISPMRDINHGRIYRVVYKEAKDYEPMELSSGDVPGLLQGIASDNMFWRMTAQRLLVASQNSEAIPGLRKIVNNREVDEIGLNSPAVHALWTLHGLGALEGSDSESLQVAIKALSHPAAGVRKAAVSVLPKNQQAIDAIYENDMLRDPDLNVRMSALLAVASFPSAEETGRKIFEATRDEKNAEDPWLTKALLAAAITHQDGYRAAQKSAASKVSPLGKQILAALDREVYVLPRRGALPFPVNVQGKEILVKASISKEEEDMQGVIVAHGGSRDGYGLYIRDGKLNMVVNQDGKSYRAVSKGTLPGKFDLVMKLTGQGEMMLLINGKQAGKGKAPSLFTRPLLSNIRVRYDFDNEDKIGDYEGSFRLTAGLSNVSLELTAPSGDAAPRAAFTTERSPGAAADARQITIVADKMQYDLKTFTVKAGQQVMVALDNRDGMQHNLLIIQPGTLEKVGTAADELARDPKSTQKMYVPEIPEVLHATKLLNPGEIVTLTFTAPEKPGDYPFVCTFPGHWRMMNGIMKVIP